jgi:cytochrome bd ubiquinol oxidase subunit II
VLTALLPLQSDAPTLAGGLETRGAPLIALSALAGLSTLGLLWRHRFRPGRVTALVAVACVVTGWGVGQYPWLLVDQVTIEQAAGAESTLTALLVTAGLALVVVLPPLAYLFRLTQSEAWAGN